MSVRNTNRAPQPVWRGARFISKSRFKRSVRQRIGPHLYLEHFRIGVLAAFAMEVGACAGRGPDAAAFPTLRVVVDPAVDILGKEALRVGHAQRDELPVD